MIYKIFILALFFSSSLLADVKSTNGQIKFDVDSDTQEEMRLNETGLGIGVNPSTNLHVNGNAIISDKLTIGGTSGAANLNLSGSYGFGIQTATTNVTLDQYSMVLADSSSGNITLTLPNPTSISGRQYYIKKTSTENRVILKTGGYNIDNNSTYIFSSGNLGSINVYSDGNQWYIISIDSEKVSPYVFTELASATFDGFALYVAGEELQPYDMLYNNDGSRLYVLGGQADSINRYDLSTNYDISTATFNSTVLSVSTYEGSPRGMIFNDDGSKLYVTGQVSDNITQYNLSTPYDISTAIYNSMALDVSGEELNPYDLTFNNDGTKLFVMGTTGDDINQYDLSTAYDISTAGTNTVVLDINGTSGETKPSEMVFNNDGTRLYVVGEVDDIIYQYDIGTAYDLTTATLNGNTINVSAYEGTITTMMFNNDFTKLYVLGIGSDNIIQYDTEP